MNDDRNGRLLTGGTIDPWVRHEKLSPSTDGIDIAHRSETSDLMRRLEATQELSGMGDWKYDAATGNVTWSRGVFHLLGRDPLSGQMSFDEYLFNYCPQDSERLLDTMETVILKNERRVIEMRATLMNGETVRHRCTLIPLSDRLGLVTGINGFLQGIAGQENNAQGVETFVSGSRPGGANPGEVAFRFLLPDGICEYISPEVLAVSGRPPSEWYGSPFLIRNLLPPSWLDRFDRKLSGLLTGNAPDTPVFPITHLSGELRWIRLKDAMLSVRAGDLVALEGIAVDITERIREDAERKRLTRELRKALAGVRALNDLLPICSFCKKVRDDHGIWTEIESFLTEQCDLYFTHGLCPDCLETHYPGYNIKLISRNQSTEE